MEFVVDRDDLDELAVAVIEVEGWRFVFERHANNPVPGTAIYSLEAGDPLAQAQVVARACDLEPDVDRWWDGAVWRDGPLPLRTA